MKMSFRLRVKYYLVHQLNYAGKEADKIIASGDLTLDGERLTENVIMDKNCELKLNNEIIKARPSFKYCALHKPVGIESTFNPKIKDNLSTVFPFNDSFFIAGRLDKASEGLLLISNDGKWINEISRPDSGKEKEYEVEVNDSIDEAFIDAMQKGVNIGFYVTRPCKAWKLGERKFGIILTEGKNKQIRRMCKALKRRVNSLKRIRIDKFYLSDLHPVEYKLIEINKINV